MKSFASRIEIHAPVDKIWRILTDLPRWAQWNTTVERTVGDIERGAKVTVFVKLNPGHAGSFAQQQPRRLSMKLPDKAISTCPLIDTPCTRVPCRLNPRRG
jgi:hypothetical protein